MIVRVVDIDDFDIDPWLMYKDMLETEALTELAKPGNNMKQYIGKKYSNLIKYLIQQQFSAYCAAINNAVMSLLQYYHFYYPREQNNHYFPCDYVDSIINSLNQTMHMAVIKYLKQKLWPSMILSLSDQVCVNEKGHAWRSLKYVNICFMNI